MDNLTFFLLNGGYLGLVILLWTRIHQLTHRGDVARHALFDLGFALLQKRYITHREFRSIEAGENLTDVLKERLPDGPLEVPPLPHLLPVPFGYSAEEIVANWPREAPPADLAELRAAEAAAEAAEAKDEAKRLKKLVMEAVAEAMPVIVTQASESTIKKLSRKGGF